MKNIILTILFLFPFLILAQNRITSNLDIETDILGDVTLKSTGEPFTGILNMGGMDEESYVNGKSFSSVRHYESGQLKNVIFWKGALNGSYRHGYTIDFYENGNLSAVTQYANGKKNGMSRSYYENGLLKSEGAFINRKQHGIWNWNYPDGGSSVIRYSNGKEISRRDL